MDQTIDAAVKDFCSSLDNLKKADAISKSLALTEFKANKEKLLDIAARGKTSIITLKAVVEALVSFLSFVRIIGQAENPLEIFLLEITPQTKDSDKSFFIYFYRTYRFRYESGTYVKKGRGFNSGIKLLIEKICQAAKQAEVILKTESRSSFRVSPLEKLVRSPQFMDY